MLFEDPNCRRGKPLYQEQCGTVGIRPTVPLQCSLKGFCSVSVGSAERYRTVESLRCSPELHISTEDGDQLLG